MSQKTINKSLQNTLISPLTHDLFWSQFLNSMSYEMSNMVDKYSTIKNNWNIEKSDKENLIRISESFGYTPNLIINNTVDMAKREIESIPYRIREKTTYNGYNLIFQQNNSLGEIFNYYWNGEKLIKVINYKSTSEALTNSNHYSPFLGIKAERNNSSAINVDVISLDYGHFLDEEIKLSVWKLDTPYIQIPTNHLGIEYFPQHYYCSYSTSLGLSDSNTLTYESQIQFVENYIRESMLIKINGIILNTRIETHDNKEYFINDVLETNSYFDVTNNLIHLEFTDIPSDYEISVSYDINLFINSDYFYYLEQGTEYNRRCPIIPHCGIFLSADIASTRGSDFYYPNEGNYTIPDLKIKAITASSYNRRVNLRGTSRLDNAFDAEGNPSGEENYQLDSVIKWFLDSKLSQSESLLNNFKYIACGNGALSVINEEHNQMFNTNSILFYYNLNSDDYSHKIFDASNNSINCNVVGNDIKINSVISKSLNFDGETYANSELALNIDSSLSYTLGTWFKATSSTTTWGTIFDSFIKISYNYGTNKIQINSTQYNCSKDNYHFLCLLFSANKVKVYLDKQLLGSFNFTISVTSSQIYLGVDSTIHNYFYGEIDNIWLISKTLTTNEISYIYDNKISLISHMGNRLSYYKLCDDEKHEDENYDIVQSYVKSMDISNEITMLEDNPNETHIYSYKTKFAPISPSYFNMTYIDSLLNTITIQSNKNGEFYDKESGKIITGNIDFKTGIWNLAKNTIKSISQKPIIKISDEPYTKRYTPWYKVIDYTDSESIHHYNSYNIETEVGGDKIIADDYKDGELKETTFIVTADGDNSNPKVKLYSKDNEETFHIYKNNVLSENSITCFVVTSDDAETPLFSDDDGKKLYANLTDLKNGTNQLKAYIDLGEASGRTLYSKNDGTKDSMYLDVACSSEKNVKKWDATVSGSTNHIFVYTLGNDTNTCYSDLTFTSIVIVESKDDTVNLFNLMNMYIKTNQIELKHSKYKTVYEYKEGYGINYIPSFSEPIESEGIELVKNSINFTYWLNDNQDKQTASVDDEGWVHGENILSGQFNFTTNTLTVQFIEEVKSDIVVSYEYYDSLDIDYTKPITMNYKIEQSIKINEIGLEDENHELMAYMTFPNIEFNTIYDNISALFAIARQS